MIVRIAAALCAVLVLPAAAGEFVPGANGATLARSFALPALGDTAVLARRRTETRLVVDVTNEYVLEGACPTECIVQDGETTRLRLVHRRALGANADLTVDVPYLWQGGGSLDGWIQDWHDWLGLPNGGREMRPDDQYLFRYVRDGAVLLDHTEGADGIGDVGVGLGVRLGRGAALRALAKVPTGDSAGLLGGNAGAAAWLDLALPLPSGWDGYVAGGVSLNERGNVLPTLQNRTILFGGVGVLAPLARGVRLHLQLQGNTPRYDDSDLTSLSRVGLPLTIGLQFRGRGTAVDVGFQEDPSVNGSPDFAAYLAITRHPN